MSKAENSKKKPTKTLKEKRMEKHEKKKNKDQPES